MSVRLLSVELQNFRGFNRAQVLDLDADVVLIHGDNGTGKTSLTDGILWLLTGSAAHLTERVKGLRQTHDPIANRYGSGPSKVKLALVSNNEHWTFERLGDARQSTLLTTRDGLPLEGSDWLPEAFGASSAESLANAVTTWGVLRQDAIRSVLDTGGAALHERMSSVIGLADVTRFRDACRTLVKSASADRRAQQQDHATARAALARADSALAALNEHGGTTPGPTVAERVRAVVAAADVRVAVDVEGTHDLNGVASLGQTLNGLHDLAVAAADAYDRLVSSRASIPQSSDELQHEVEATQRRAAELDQVSSQTQRLAEAALDLLSERCPVCDQSIDEPTVREKLQADLRTNSAQLVVAVEARNLLAASMQRLAEARSAEQRQSDAEQALAVTVSEFQSSLHRAGMSALADSIEPERLRVIARRIENLRNALRTVYADVQAEVELDSTRLQASAKAAREIELEVRVRADAATEREETAKKLEKAAQIGADRIVARWLGELEPSFAEVFDRLAPHPTFSVLRARQDVYYNKNQIVPEVFDPIAGISANPLLVYSEGQLNTVALSYFLGLVLNSPARGLGFMVLDDPLQAMDVLAVLGFADLCRRLRPERQLIITTHDRRYADVLARKLAPREATLRTITHEFGSWSPQGPEIVTAHEILGLNESGVG